MADQEPNTTSATSVESRGTTNRRMVLTEVLAFIAAIAGAAAALFAGWQALVATRTLHEATRPWVFAEKVEFVTDYNHPPSDRFFVLTKIKIHNYGTSVANDGISYLFAKPRTERLATDWDQACKLVDQNRPSLVANTPWPLGFSLPPNGETTLILTADDETITREQIARGQFYLLGCAIYYDTFKIKHTTRFCFNPVISTDRSKPSDFQNVADIPFEVCNSFQSAD